jgi:two-component system capsular synthesis sensor histidine kinase RcsC
MPIPGDFCSAALPSSIKAGAEKTGTSKPPHILVVDDIQAIIEVVRDVLIGDGFTVESTTDTTDALAWLTARPAAFDAIVSDLDMPHMSGTALLMRARQAGFRGWTVIHSGSLADANEEELKLRADAVIEKPFATRTLGPTLRRLLA